MTKGNNMKYMMNAGRWARSLTTIVFVFTIAACGGEISEEELINTAKSYIAEKQIREAALELKNVLQTNPDNAEARYLLGQIQLEIGDAPSAEKEFRRAAEAGWNEEQTKIALARAMLLQQKYNQLLDEVKANETWSAEARANLMGLHAAAKAATGDIAQARLSVAEADRIAVDALEVIKTDAQLLFLEGKNDKALARLSVGLEKYPGQPELLLLSANGAVRSEDTASAKTFFTRVIDLAPPQLMTRHERAARLGAAKLYILEKQNEQAHVVLDPLLKVNANDPEANYLAGVLAINEQEYDTSEVHIRKILKLAPSHSPSLLLLGVVSYAKGEYEQAAYNLSKYVSAQPDNLQARKLLGRTYLELEQPDQAGSVLRSAHDTGTKDAELLALVGLTELQSGEVQAGVLELEKAIALEPDSVILRQQLAKAYIAEGETEQAVDELEKIINSGESVYQAEVMVVFAYLKDNKPDKALQAVQEMVDKYPEDAGILNLMGIVQHENGSIDKARQYFELSLQKAPDNNDAALNLARLEEKAGNIDQAIKRYSAIVDAAPGNIKALMALARLAGQQGEGAERVKWLEEARKADKRELDARVKLAEHYIKSNDLAAAEKIIGEIEAEHPGNAAYLAVRAQLLIARKSYNQAETVLNQLLEAQPDLFVGHYLFGLNKYRMRQTQSARTSLERAYEIQPQNLSNLALLAQVVLETQDYQRALSLGEEVKKIAPEMSAGYLFTGDGHLGLRQYQQALEAYEAAWRFEQTRDIVLRRYHASRNLYKDGRAMALLSDWLDQHPDDNSLRFTLAEAYQASGQDDLALKHYRQILDRQPENVAVLNNAAWILNQKDDPIAMEYAERAYKLMNNSAAIKDTYGWVLLNNDKKQQALQLLTEAARELPEIPEVQYHHAMAVYASGEHRQAIAMLEKLLASHSEFEGSADARALIEAR